MKRRHRRAPNGFRIRRYRAGETLDQSCRKPRWVVYEEGGAICAYPTREKARLIAVKAAATYGRGM